jgi:uncharacterized protein
VHFVFDEAKNRANKEKHGIDFVEAQAIWFDPRRTHTAARTVCEQRLMVIGAVDGKLWSAVITYRGETVRLISVRRSRAKEAAIYDLGE